MKSLEEIQTMLVNELWNSLDNLKALNSKPDYYNTTLGDTSYLLAGMLGKHMAMNKDWPANQWFDDCLLTDVKQVSNRLSIWGITIWGRDNTTEQWTDPLLFKVELGNTKPGFNRYTLMFGDSNKPEITYEEFIMNRSYWEEGKARDWKFTISKMNS